MSKFQMAHQAVNAVNLKDALDYQKMLDGENMNILNMTQQRALEHLKIFPRKSHPMNKDANTNSKTNILKSRSRNDATSYSHAYQFNNTVAPGQLKYSL